MFSWIHEQTVDGDVLINRFTRERKGLTLVHTYLDIFTCDTHISDFLFGLKMEVLNLYFRV